MTVMDQKTKELIGVAVSVVAKCMPCLDYHVAEARKAGATEDEMIVAVRLARMVRQAGDANMDKYTDETLGVTVLEQPAPSACCCGSDSDCCP